MYRHCIHCPAALGENAALERFPVGRTVAFDPARGRLWAVCPRCARWNLAPLEERWEAVEDAERLFHASPVRAGDGRVALCRLGDGTRLVRVGRAATREAAAWRYGGALLRRWDARHAVRGPGLLSRAASAMRTAADAASLAAAPVTLLVSGELLPGRLVARVASEESPTGAALDVRRRDLDGAWLEPAADGPRLLLSLDRPSLAARLLRRGREDGGATGALDGEAARRVLRRAMVHVNRRGGPPARVDAALDALALAGGAGPYLRRAALRAASLAGDAPADALALEMALHEETERRALGGELAGLAAAWREAEAVAAIADGLPDTGPTHGRP